MTQNSEEPLGSLQNVQSQIQRDGPYSLPKAIDRSMESSESPNQLYAYGFNLSEVSYQVPPSKGVPHFKTQSGVQPSQLLEQDRQYSTPGSAPSKRVPRLKLPSRSQPTAQPSQPPRQDGPYSASGVSPSNGAPPFQVPFISQPIAQQLDKQIEQSEYHSTLGMPLSND